MEYVYYGLGGALVVGLVVLLVRVRRWIGQSTTEGLQETLRFAELYGLEPLDADGRTLKGVVEGLPVTLSEGAILTRATEGRIGRMRTLCIVVQVQSGKGRWLLCERELAERLERPLPELGEEHELNEPRAARRFLLRATQDPRFSSDTMLLDAIVGTDLKMGRVAEGRAIVDFLVPVEFVGGLGGGVATLGRLLMVGLALADPARSRHFLGKEPAYR
jgi:hypothetical protein